MFTNLDVAGFKRRSVIPPGDVQTVDQRRPGFIAAALSRVQSHVYARLRKRYGKSIPFGQVQPQPLATGTAPPAILFSGVPLVGSNELVLACTAGGGLGVALFKLSLDGGTTWPVTGLVAAAALVLPGTGVTAACAAGTYATDNVYHAATPVLEQILSWMTAIAGPDVYRARGVNAADPQIKEVFDAKTEAETQLLEAANGDTGLLDLPVNEDGDSAITTGGPLGYTETSPYAWTDIQECEGRSNDRSQSGDSFSS